VLRLDREASERVRHHLASTSDPGLAQRSLDGSHHRGDRAHLDIDLTDEEVQVVRVPVDRATRLPAGGRATDEADLPSEVTAYALRDLDKLIRQAARHGTSVGAYATALLDSPLPWTKMRQVYRLLGLAKKFGPERVETALFAGACV
jgi:hypothetical protein